MTTAEIAADFAAMCIRGDWDAAGAKYWSPDIVSIEAAGPDPIARGLDAVHAKGEWWYSNHEIHSVEAAGPFVNGDQFIMRFKMDLTFKPTGERTQMEEEGLYTVKDGKVVEERFFYGQ
jgi:ketosteroid isomerase-like protein